MGLTALCHCLVLATMAPAASAPTKPLVIYRNGLRSGWQDFGWTRRDVVSGESARIDFFDYGGWVIGGRETHGRFSALLMWLRAPVGYGDFLAVRLSGGTGMAFPTVSVAAACAGAPKGQWCEVRVPYEQLNPDSRAFDTITLSATRPVPSGWVYLNNIVLEPRGAPTAKVAMPLVGEGRGGDSTPGDPMTMVASERLTMLGVGAHIGGGIPAGGGSASYVAGLSVRLTFVGEYVGVGAQAWVSYHTLAAQTGDTTGRRIDASSQVVMVPMLGVLTLRLPLGRVALYTHAGCGGAWVWAARQMLGSSRSTHAATWAVHGAVGTELSVGPGWLGLEAGYLTLPMIDLSGVLQDFRGSELTLALHYRLGM